MSFLAATIPLRVLPCISIHSSNHSGQRDAGSDTLRQLHGLRTDSLTLVIPMCIWTNNCESNSVLHIILLLLKYIHTIKP